MTDDRIPDDEPRLREAVSRLPDELPPARDLWPDIRAELEADRMRDLPLAARTPERGARRMIQHWPTLAAAATILVVASVGVTWQLMRTRDLPPAAPTAPATSGSASFARFASYERSAAELRTALDQRAELLDPATREVLERSLRTIDEALLEARAALERDPSSASIRTYVESAYRHKLEFLRRANDVAALRGS